MRHECTARKDQDHLKTELGCDMAEGVTSPNQANLNCALTMSACLSAAQPELPQVCRNTCEGLRIRKGRPEGKEEGEAQPDAMKGLP